jgi:hypothetical protein
MIATSHKNKALVELFKGNEGAYIVSGRAPTGLIFDRVRVFNYKDALRFYKAFNRVAKKLEASK